MVKSETKVRTCIKNPSWGRMSCRMGKPVRTAQAVARGGLFVFINLTRQDMNKEPSMMDFVSDDPNVNPTKKWLENEKEKAKYNRQSRVGAFFGFLMLFGSLALLFDLEKAVVASIGLIGLVILINAKIRIQ